MSGVLSSSASSPSTVPAEKRQAVREYVLVLLAYVAIFVAVALDVTRGGVLVEIDPHVARWSTTSVPEWGHTWARRLTHLGDARFLALVVVLTACWLVYRRRHLAAGLLGAAAAATGALTVLLKDAFGRPRPLYTDPGGHVHSFSFPSGHASGAFAIYVLCALLLTAGAGARVRAGAVTASIAIAILVGTTRVVMPVHYLTDVIAGAAIGLTVAVAALLAQALVRAR